MSVQEQEEKVGITYCGTNVTTSSNSLDIDMVMVASSGVLVSTSHGNMMRHPHSILSPSAAARPIEIGHSTGGATGWWAVEEILLVAVLISDSTDIKLLHAILNKLLGCVSQRREGSNTIHGKLCLGWCFRHILLMKRRHHCRSIKSIHNNRDRDSIGRETECSIPCHVGKTSLTSQTGAKYLFVALIDTGILAYRH